VHPPHFSDALSRIRELHKRLLNEGVIDDPEWGHNARGSRGWLCAGDAFYNSLDTLLGEYVQGGCRTKLTGGKRGAGRGRGQGVQQRGARADGGCASSGIYAGGAGGQQGVSLGAGRSGHPSPSHGHSASPTPARKRPHSLIDRRTSDGKRQASHQAFTSPAEAAREAALRRQELREEAVARGEVVEVGGDGGGWGANMGASGNGRGGSGGGVGGGGQAGARNGKQCVRPPPSSLAVRVHLEDIDYDWTGAGEGRAGHVCRDASAGVGNECGVDLTGNEQGAAAEGSDTDVDEEGERTGEGQAGMFSPMPGWVGGGGSAGGRGADRGSEGEDDAVGAGGGYERGEGEWEGQAEERGQTDGAGEQDRNGGQAASGRPPVLVD
jgi:hypothetical protein